MHRCLAQLTITAGDHVEHLWPGLEVNLARELRPGFTLGDAVAGREACFARVEPEKPSPKAAKAASSGALTPVGDNPLQSESVLHESTVKDIVRAAKE